MTLDLALYVHDGPMGDKYNAVAPIGLTMPQWRAANGYSPSNVAADEYVNGGGVYYLSPHGVSSLSVPWDIEFLVDDDFVSVITHVYAGIGETVRIWVDDKEIKTWLTAAGGVQATPVPFPGITSYLWYSFNFKDRRTRKIRMAGMNYMFGVTTNSDGKTYSLGSDIDTPVNKTIGVVSDSWFVAMANMSDTVATHFKTLTGWDVHNMAIGGSGYLNSIKYGHPTRVAALGARQLDALIINGSCNDLAYTEAAVMDEMGDYFDLVRQEQGDIPIFHMGLEDSEYFRTTWPAIDLEDRENTLMDFAESDPSVVGTFRGCNRNIHSGTGHEGAPAGNGNVDWKLYPDGVHLSSLGTWDQARLLVETMKPAPAKLIGV